MFTLATDFVPAGDQPAAIDQLVTTLSDPDVDAATLLGATGTGKTFTVAHTLAALQRPALVLAPNKTLAGQLAAELSGLFPDAAVSYFVSYYAYYQPEAYVAASDLYIAKDSAIDKEVERLRHQTTSALLSRPDTIVVASVSAMYALGAPDTYREHALLLTTGTSVDLDTVLRQLITMTYRRTDLDIEPGTFRVRGDTIELLPAAGDRLLRIELFGDEIETLTWLDPINRHRLRDVHSAAVFPASHYLADPDHLEAACKQIEQDLDTRVDELKTAGSNLEARRLTTRTRHDLEMIRETGVCAGIENYARYFDGREPGQRPYTLLDYFPDNFLTIIDESHVTIPQMHGQLAGDRSRKQQLVDHGFRLPSCLENRPLSFDEFLDAAGQHLYVSATPGRYEQDRSPTIAQQVIRPTGVCDPTIDVAPTDGQVDDLVRRIGTLAARDERVLVTTLTKRMAEDLTDYLVEQGVRARWMHADLETLERTRLLEQLRAGEFDVLVGINLLREGLDLPEVALVAIFDADKPGFLRSETALIQTFGRAARNIGGHVVMYADVVTDQMRAAIDETDRRRTIQQDHNETNGITPTTIVRRRGDMDDTLHEADDTPPPTALPDGDTDLQHLVVELREQMEAAADELQFERAARLRDQLAAAELALAELDTPQVRPSS